MSYDIYLRASKDPCPTCGRAFEEPHLPDPTYNLTPIFDRALSGEDLPNPEVSEFAAVIFKAKTDRPRGLRLLNGRKAGDTVEWLRKACAHLEDPAEESAFRALEPDNKWGDLEGAREVMRKLLEAAERVPLYTWEIW